MKQQDENEDEENESEEEKDSEDEEEPIEEGDTMEEDDNDGKVTEKFFRKQFEKKKKNHANPLTVHAPRISESWIKIKINLNFDFHFSLWCLKRFYEGHQGLHKTFWGTTKKCENKNLS